MKLPVKKDYKFKKIRYLILGIIIITPLLIFTVFLISGDKANNKKKIVEKIAEKSDISLKNINHIATKDGKKEWSFKSDTLTFNASKQKAEIKNLSLTFFLKNKKEANLTANNGTFDYKSNDIEAFGNVIITDGDYIIKTERLFYNDKNKIISSESHVKISGKNLDIEANSIILNINKNIAELNGDINAFF